MTTIELKNENKTKISFGYDNGLPYKKSIRPELEYGEWEKYPNKILMNVILNQKELILFKNPNDINGLATYTLDDEFWIDLDDVYLVFSYDKKVEVKIKENNLIIAFYFNEKLLSVIGK